MIATAGANARHDGGGGQVELWTAARAAREIGCAPETAADLARKHLGNGTSRVGNYLVASAEWWRAHLAERRAPLSEATKAEIKRLAARGLTGYQISKRLGISIGAAYYHAQEIIDQRREQQRHRLRAFLKARGASLSERDALIAQMRADGTTLREIADRVGLTRQRVHQIEQAVLRRARKLGVAS